MDQDEYISQRVDDQITYYDTQSKSSQSSFKSLTSVQIVSGALIPVISGFSQHIDYSEWITALLGIFIICATAALSLNNNQERWINFRTTCETLKHLKYLFITNSTPYKGEDNFDIFVNNIESIISKENLEWNSYSKKRTSDDEQSID